MSLKPRPTHQGLILSDHVVAEVERPPVFEDDPVKVDIWKRALCLFIDQWLPKMLHAPITRIGVEIGQEVASFDHMPLVIRSDVLKLKEVDRIAETVLVRFAYIDLTKPLHKKG
jgi:hypothetical protein